MGKNNRAPRAERFLAQIFDVVCQMTMEFSYLRSRRQREPAAVNLSSSAFTWRTVRAKQAKKHFAYFLQRDQHGVIAKQLA